MRKLRRSRRGESYAELLISILIIALAALLLASMAFASANLNRTAKKMDEELYAAVTDVGNGAGEARKGKVEFEIEGKEKGTLDVDVFTSGNLSAYSRSE